MNLNAVGDAEVDAELTRRVEASKPVEEPLAPLPEPTTRARPATAAEVARARSCKTAVAIADGAGWKTSVHYACGPLMGANGQLLEEGVESLVLRGGKGCRHLVAVWLQRPSQPNPKDSSKEQWKLDCAYVFPPVEAIGGNDIKKVLGGNADEKEAER